MRQAKDPFQFVTASYLVRICPERARTLGELGRYLRSCTDASIFYHTFQSLESHHYTAFSSDFAQWVMAACNEASLAERLAAVDVRDCVSLQDLREALAGRVEDHIQRTSSSADRPAFEPFHFCEAIEVTLPRAEQAHNLAELAEGIRKSSLQTIHYHFINSRLRLQLQTNDFSHWLQHSLEMPELAKALNRIDIYMNSLDELRLEMLTTIQAWMDR